MPTEDEVNLMFQEYKELWKKNKYSEKSVGWNKPKHYKRFELAVNPWSNLKDNSQISILDFGCGLGHLYEFLKKNNYLWNYTGIDINPHLIDEAKKKHKDGFFQVGDFDSFVKKQNFDLIFFIGTFNRKFSDSSSLMYTSINKAISLSRMGVHLSALAPWALTKYEKNFYPSLSIFESCVNREYVSGLNITSNRILGEMSVDYYIHN